MGKVIDSIRQAQRDGGTTVSFEFFPAKTPAGINNLLARVEEMAVALRPTFVTLTWRSAFEDEKLWLSIGSIIQKEFNIDVVLHLTCHLPKEDLKRILRNCREAGIRNILALRGDPPIGESRWKPIDGGFRNAVELVKLIREEHGDYFCIAVAAYPEVHIESWNHPELPPSEQAIMLDLQRLKAKQDAGADFIITQLFFDADNLLEWIKKCRAIGITIPILPGYLPIQNYQSFKKFTSWCKTKVPAKVEKDLSLICNDDAAVREYGVQLGIETWQKLMDNGVRYLHFYTMNLAHAVTRILQGLNKVPKPYERELPWQSTSSAGGGRKSGANSRAEEIRPIFWAYRQTSYVARTADWDEYPNGRWGDSRSPAYGELTDYYLAFKRPKVDRKKLWGIPKREEDIVDVFVGFIEGKIRVLPWCDNEMSTESSSILSSLKFINQNGFLTINSQPRVNGVSSVHPYFGWGGEGGYVFQKAYVEFFVSPEKFFLLLEAFPLFPSLSYHAMNNKGDEYSNVSDKGVNAVTWGVFPGREIIQPTVVDPASFAFWKDEAFGLWKSQWASAYDGEREEETRAKEVIEKIYDTYFLVNIVDNNYVSDDADIFAIFYKVIVDSMSNDQLKKRVQTLEAENDKMRETVSRLKTLQVESSKEMKALQETLNTVRRENDLLKNELRHLNLQLAVTSPRKNVTGQWGQTITY